MNSKLDKRGNLYIDCSECNRGGNGQDEEKCSCGWQIIKPNRGGCFIGDLMQKYHFDLEALRKELEARDV